VVLGAVPGKRGIGIYRLALDEKRNSSAGSFIFSISVKYF
jgi:glutaminase